MENVGRADWHLVGGQGNKYSPPARFDKRLSGKLLGRKLTGRRKYMQEESSKRTVGWY